MEKVVFVKEDDLTEINKLLKAGWCVKEFKILRVPKEDSYRHEPRICAYFVLKWETNEWGGSRNALERKE